MPSFSGTIQIAKIPAGAAESFYDVAAGVYATSATISSFANGVTTHYNIAWDKGGPYENDTNHLMFALPHHLESFDSTTKTLGM
jgi:endo-1,3(4)-beta-glucanase